MKHRIIISLFATLLLLTSCVSTPTIYVVQEIDYINSTYDNRLKYSLSLIKANALNKSLALSNKYNIIYITPSFTEDYKNLAGKGLNTNSNKDQ